MFVPASRCDAVNGVLGVAEQLVESCHRHRADPTAVNGSSRLVDVDASGLADADDSSLPGQLPHPAYGRGEQVNLVRLRQVEAGVDDLASRRREAAILADADAPYSW